MALGDITKAPDRRDNTGYHAVPPSDANQNSTMASGAALLPNASGDYLNQKPKYSNFTKWGTLITLFIVNLLNYMDRFTIVGVLSAVQHEFQIGKTKAGLLQTIFIISYMCLSPVVGYLGDRYNRKIIILIGLIFWTAVVFLSSFIRGPENFWLFLTTRALVGIGEASYSCIAPTVITDLFEPSKRNLVVSIFVIAIPVGSGLGFVAGSSMVKFASEQGWGGWEWALRVTPPFGLACILLSLVFIPNNIPRGHSDGMSTEPEKESSYIQDVKYLLRNKSWRYITMGFIGVSFTIGSLSVWFPQFLALAYVLRGDIAPCMSDSCEYSDIMRKFGIITAVSGLGGVGVGLFSSNKWKLAGNGRADAEICAIGQFVLGITTVVAVFVCYQMPDLTWTMGLIGLVGGCVNWALMVNMTMETCVPKRRATANAVQMFLGHALGDAISPVLIGAISDSLTHFPFDVTVTSTFQVDYNALKYAMLLCPLASIMGGAFFLKSANHIEDDKKKVMMHIKNEQLTDSSEMVNTSSDASQTSADSVGYERR